MTPEHHRGVSLASQTSAEKKHPKPSPQKPWLPRKVLEMPQIVMASQWFFLGWRGGLGGWQWHIMGITTTCVFYKSPLKLGFVGQNILLEHVFFPSFVGDWSTTQRGFFLGGDFLVNKNSKKGGFLGMIGQWLFIPMSLKGGERFTFLTWICDCKMRGTSSKKYLPKWWFWIMVMIYHGKSKLVKKNTMNYINKSNRPQQKDSSQNMVGGTEVLQFPQVPGSIGRSTQLLILRMVIASLMMDLF